MLELKPEWKQLENEIKKAMRKHEKDIKKNLLKLRATIDTFIKQLTKQYHYKHFTINECVALVKKYKKI